MLFMVPCTFIFRSFVFPKVILFSSAAFDDPSQLFGLAPSTLRIPGRFPCSKSGGVLARDGNSLVHEKKFTYGDSIWMNLVIQVHTLYRDIFVLSDSRGEGWNHHAPYRCGKEIGGLKDV